MIEKYLDKIREATNRPGEYAYRGQAKSSWSLHSGATRRMISEVGDAIQLEPRFLQMYISYHRDTLLEPARTQGFGIEEGNSISDLQLLAKLQHFGAATGLLDFTWDPLIALWFACQGCSMTEAETESSMLLTPMTPSALQGFQTMRMNTKSRICSSPASNSHPLYYWEPMLNGDAMSRILRQRSVFVIGRPLVPDDPQYCGRY